MVHIASPSNLRFKLWRRQADGEVRKTGRTLVCGARVCHEVASTLPEERMAWIVPADFEGELPGSAAIPRHELARGLFSELDRFGTGYPLLDVAVDDRIVPPPTEFRAGLYLALPLQDPVNVGAVIRTAAGLGVSGVFLLPSCANPFHPRSVRTSAGAVFKLPLHAIDDLAELAARGLEIVGLDSGGEPIEAYRFPERAVLLVGQEGGGLAQTGGLSTLKHVRISVVALPMQGIESYNANVAAALAMYEWKKRCGQRKP
jgi:tRNA G18 (ribose-2'-O)-methylase SpoU